MLERILMNTISRARRLSSTFFSARNYNNARRYYQTPVYDQEENFKKLSQRAIDYEKKGDLLEAEKTYEKIIYEVDPTKKESYDNLVRIMSKRSIFAFTENRMEKLLEQYEKNVKKCPDNNLFKNR